MKENVSIFWFRRDLRIRDNAGLFAALNGGMPVLPVFIFDTDILEKLEDKDDRRVSFIHHHLTKLKKELEHTGSSILVKHGKPEDVFTELISTYNVRKVFANHDYEPYARERDENIRQILENKNIEFHTFKDQVILEKDEVIKDDGTPYTVYTPYMRKWKRIFRDNLPLVYPSENLTQQFLQCRPFPMPTIRELGFTPNKTHFPPKEISRETIAGYDKTRDFPGIDGTSRLSAHLRFGTVSIRKLVSLADELNETWLNELIWREFYMMILWHFPSVVSHSFNKEYDNISWRNDEEEFRLWCDGRTGFPLVDAGMRQLNQTGFMHNRARMITAGFLTRDLLIDWRWGESYFAGKLLDYELASNNGGWQWAAGTGVDAAPYFRIFNPETQQKKFDSDMAYAGKYIPELNTGRYPGPMVDHKAARKLTLKTYQEALKR